MGGLFAPEQLTEDRERGSKSGTKLLLLTFDCFRNSLCRDPALGGKWCVRSQVEGVREGSVALCLFSLAGPAFSPALRHSLRMESHEVDWKSSRTFTVTHRLVHCYGRLCLAFLPHSLLPFLDGEPTSLCRAWRGKEVSLLQPLGRLSQDLPCRLHFLTPTSFQRPSSTSLSRRW